MLQTLHIQNVALIDELDISFSDGFHILTGETGAGKSILIDAVNFVLGERASRELIQTGAERASVEASFSIGHAPALLKQLEALGIAHEEGDCLIISRVLTAAGKNTVRVNGTLLNLASLKSITSLLVDIHGQHEHQSLLYQDSHIAFLDACGDAGHQACRAEVAARYHAWKEIEKALSFGFPSPQDRARRMDILSYQIAEIQEAQLTPGLEEELEGRLRLLANAQQIRAALELCYSALADEPGAVPAAGEARAQLQSISEYHSDYQAALEQLNEAYYGLQDVAHELRGMKDAVEYDPAELQLVESRIGLLQSLKRKYGGSVVEILQFQNDAEAEYAELQKSESRKEELEAALAQARQAYTDSAKRLTALREKLGKQLGERLLLQLRDLGMEHARFGVSIFTLASPSPEGMDEVEFLLSANKGEPLKPLQKVASGGELSRIMLAFKTIRFGEIPTIIFDEIDAGISGQIAAAVGHKMLDIAAGHQVLCVTHLPQIAALADVHYYVEKYEKNAHTYSRITRLDTEARITELARIMGADADDSKAFGHARELLEKAAVYKQSTPAGK